MNKTKNFNNAPHGLLPIIIQDAETKNVIAVAYQNEEAYQRSQDEGILYIAQTGNQHVELFSSNGFTKISVEKEIFETEGKSILCYVNLNQNRKILTAFGENNIPHEHFLHKLENLINDRKINPVEGSYTNKLFAKGINKVAQKVGEEAVELVIEAKDNNKDLFLGEAADLMYHYLVLLAAKNYKLNEVVNVLKQRHK